MADDSRALGRRRLLLYGLAGTTAVTAGVIGYEELWKPRHGPLPIAADKPGFLAPVATIARKRRLGRTNLDVAVVGIGAGGLVTTDPIHRAVEKGINYLDTSACYGRGGSENIIGRAIGENRAIRDKLVIATKWDATARMPKERILESLDASLKRMNVDHVDIMQIHQLGDHVPGEDGMARLDNPELYAAMDDAKKAGKVRFFGATAHTGARNAILSHAIDKGAFDMILVKMNVLDFDGAGMPELLAKAKARDIGVVAMKTQPNGGMIPKGFEGAKWNVYQANLRWALSHDIACVVHSAIGTDPHVQDLAIGAVYDELTENDRALLDEYADALSPHYCRGCDAAHDSSCTSKCPDGVAIPTILRAVMYERHYEWHAQARETYQSLTMSQRWSERCASCELCTGSCPYGVNAAERVREAKRVLT